MGFNTGGAVRGGATGAMAGSAFGPVGAGIGGGAGLLIGGFSDVFGGGKSKEQEALERTQQRLAEEQKVRMEEQRQVSMQNMANRLMAFGPMNSHVASRGGQAYSPEQMSQFAADPTGGPKASLEVQRWLALPEEERARIRSAKNNGMAKIISGNTDWGKIPQEKIWELDRQAAAFGGQQGAEDQRRAMVAGAFSNAPSGPAPIQMATPAAARRF